MDTDNRNSFENASYSAFDRNANFYGMSTKVLFVDPVHDIAVLGTDATDENVRPAEVSCEAPAVGTVVKVSGYPRGNWYTETFGNVVGSKGNWDRVVSAQWPVYAWTTATAHGGNSGGPAWNAETNKVVGILVAVPTLFEQEFVNSSVIVPTTILCNEYLDHNA
jgi:hypothetical protein